MSFGDLDKQRGSRNEGPFLKFDENAKEEVVIRILDQDPVTHWQYYLTVNVGGGVRAGRSVIAGKHSPIEAYMKKLGPDNPEFRKPQYKARINVLDRSIGPDGNPKNVVKILEYGSKLDKEFGALHMRARKSDDFSQRLAIWEFDLLMTAVGRGRDREIKPMKHLDDNPLPEALLMLPRYDLQALAEPLSDEAIQALLDGAEYAQVMQRYGRTGDYPMVTPVPF